MRSISGARSSTATATTPIILSSGSSSCGSFSRGGLKKLIATHYEPNAENLSYMITAEPDADGNFDWQQEPVRTPLPCNGDFRSAACIELLKEADIVVTNPPFSLFREYVAQLVEYNKKFLIVGNKNAITYKEIFPLIRKNSMWLGFSSPSEFNTPDGPTKKVNGLTRWFTNLEHKRRHQSLDLRGNYYHGNEALFPKYDNYDAIEVSKVAEIPCDYFEAFIIPAGALSALDPSCIRVACSQPELDAALAAKDGLYVVRVYADHAEMLTTGYGKEETE